MKKIVFLLIALVCVSTVTVTAQKCSDRIQSATRMYERYKQTKDKQTLEEARKVLQNVKNTPGVSESCVKEADRLLKLWKSQSTKTTKKDDPIPYDNSGLGVYVHELEFESAGGDDDIRVFCNEGWVVSNNNDWFDATRKGDYVIVKCKPNESKEAREGTFYVLSQGGTSSEIITITQEGVSASLTISKDNLYLMENAYCHTINVKSTDAWTVSVTEGEKWCSVEKKSPTEFQICVADNPGKPRTARVHVASEGGHEKDITVSQQKHNYKGITQSYFETVGGVWKTTNFFVDLYALESIGFRMGGLAKRWKYVEFSLLNFDVGYAHHNMRIDWEPIVRGYLPVSRRDRCWSMFVGLGAAINVAEMAVPEVGFEFFHYHSVLLEVGAEYHWKKKPGVSSRIFYRYDGFSSFGISFDLYKWTPKFSRKS